MSVSCGTSIDRLLGSTHGGKDDHRPCELSRLVGDGRGDGLRRPVPYLLAGVLSPGADDASS